MNRTPEVTRGFHLSADAFRRLARLVHAASGINLTEAKRPLVVSRLSRRLRTLGLPDFDAYCALVEGADGCDERRCMLSALTTNVTRFFREQHHFTQLRNEVLPPLLARARRGGRVRLWSAGCSSGEEPYSIALTILELCPESAQFDIRILATDINRAVVATALRGHYPVAATEAIPAAIRRRYLQPVPAAPGLLAVAEAPRSLIRFGELNLLSRWPFRGPFDVIFCRNVVIYFDGPTQDQLWQRFGALLAPGGHLFIGHSERLGPEAARFYCSAGVTSYRKVETSAGGEAAPRAGPPILTTAARAADRGNQNIAWGG